MDRNGELLNRMVEWGASTDTVRAMVVFGSAADDGGKLYDQWSDLDVAIFAGDASKLSDDFSWLERFGTVGLMNTPPQFAQMRQVFYHDHSALDVGVYPTSEVENLVPSELWRSVVAKGYRVLLDKEGAVTDALKKSRSAAPPPPQVLSQGEVSEEIRKIAFHTLHVAPQVMRGDGVGAIGELFVGTIRPVCTLAIDYRRRTASEPKTSPVGLKSFDRWADEFLKNGISEIFPVPDCDSLRSSMAACLEYADRLVARIAELAGFEIDRSCLSFAMSELAWLGSLQ
jgi:hypothetical protein